MPGKSNIPRTRGIIAEDTRLALDDAGNTYPIHRHNAPEPIIGSGTAVSFQLRWIGDNKHRKLMACDVREVHTSPPKYYGPPEHERRVATLHPPLGR